jgi:GNAT superfamily N-acetyltransferase
MSLTPVPPGRLATIVTYLEMQTRPRPQPLATLPFQLVRWATPDRDRYRALFRRIGGPWLWFSRLVMADDALDAILQDPDVLLSAVVDRQGVEIGMLELDFRDAGRCELAYFGLVPELAGKGVGRWLMNHALTMAWRRGVSLVHVHTCTLDSPGALAFYRKAGFIPVRQAVETFPDPRLTGVLPEDVASHIPLIREPLID